MTLEDIKDVLEKVDEIFPPKECVSFKVENRPTTVFDNKIGGIPYFPKDMEYPTTNAGEPLALLAQINFNTFESIPNYPDKGILQVYIANEDCYGMNFDNNFDTNGFRIIYHENVIEDTEQLIDAIPYEYLELPFDREYLLTPNTPSIMYASPHLEDFEEAFVDAYNELREDQIEEIYDLDDEICEALYERNEHLDIWIGGYPVFTQSDPRYNQSGFDMLLFESDSVWGDDVDIMWGDSGTGTFFIKLEDLINKDFSNVLYSWDCC